MKVTHEYGVLIDKRPFRAACTHCVGPRRVYSGLWREDIVQLVTAQILAPVGGQLGVEHH